MLHCTGLIADGATGADDAAPNADWGAAALTEALRTVVADVGRLQNLLPELSPRDRWANCVPGFDPMTRAVCALGAACGFNLSSCAMRCSEHCQHVADASSLALFWCSCSERLLRRWMTVANCSGLVRTNSNQHPTDNKAAGQRQAGLGLGLGLGFTV